MNCIVPHAFRVTVTEGRSRRGTGAPRERGRPVESKFRDIYIGKLIQQKVDERHISYAEFARQIHCARTSLYHIFNSKNIDVERLLLISDVLDFDFIGEVYRKGRPGAGQAVPSGPYLMLPFVENRLDLTHLPPEVRELLRRQLL